MASNNWTKAIAISAELSQHPDSTHQAVGSSHECGVTLVIVHGHSVMFNRPQAVLPGCRRRTRGDIEYVTCKLNFKKTR